MPGFTLACGCSSSQQLLKKYCLALQGGLGRNAGLTLQTSTLDHKWLGPRGSAPSAKSSLRARNRVLMLSSWKSGAAFLVPGHPPQRHLDWGSRPWGAGATNKCKIVAPTLIHPIRNPGSATPGVSFSRSSLGCPGGLLGLGKDPLLRNHPDILTGCSSGPVARERPSKATGLCSKGVGEQA